MKKNAVSEVVGILRMSAPSFGPERSAKVVEIAIAKPPTRNEARI